MKTHIKHRFNKESRLELFEEKSESGNFHVTYLTQEGVDEKGREEWYLNNTQSFKNYNDAFRCFNIRRDSSNPFKAIEGQS